MPQYSPHWFHLLDLLAQCRLPPSFVAVTLLRSDTTRRSATMTLRDLGYVLWSDRICWYDVASEAFRFTVFIKVWIIFLKTTDLEEYLGLCNFCSQRGSSKEPRETEIILANRIGTLRKILAVFCLPTASDKLWNIHLSCISPHQGPLLSISQGPVEIHLNAA